MRWMTILVLFVGVAVVLGMSVNVRSEEPRTTLRVGVYDSRAIAVAYAASKHDPVGGKMKEYEQAKAAGDTKRVKELEAWGKRGQRQLHRQGFGRVPVCDLLEHVKDKMPEMARKTGVAVIARQCDYTSSDVEVVDVTKELVSLFDPSEKTLETVEALKKHKPMDLDVIEQNHEH